MLNEIFCCPVSAAVLELSYVLFYTPALVCLYLTPTQFHICKRICTTLIATVIVLLLISIANSTQFPVQRGLKR